MNSDTLFFFREHMDALPMYEKLEEQILSRIPDVKIKVAKTQITFAISGALRLCPSIPAEKRHSGRKSG